MRLKILFLIGTFGRGGKERQLVELVRNLPAEEFEIHVLSKNGDPYFMDQIKDNVSSHKFFKQNTFGFKDILYLRQVVTDVKPDIVYSWVNVLSHFALVTMFTVPRTFVLINGGIRYAPGRLNIRQKVEAFLYNLYPFVVANSEAGLRSFGQTQKSGRFVLYNGFDLKRVPLISKNQAKNTLGFPQDRFAVSMVARLDAAKDYRCFIKCAAECLKKDRSISFYAVGEGEERKELEKLCDSLKIGPYFTFCGNRNDVEMVLKATDLSVLCSKTGNFGEGIPNAILESQACGTPVIATDCGGVPEVIINGENGYLVEPGDYKMLASRILELKGNKAKLELFSEEGLKTLHRKFDISTMVERFQVIVRSALSKHASILQKS